jgi:hypothetical protein
MTATAHRILFLFTVMIIANTALAHDVVIEMSATDSAILYLRLGYEHILPLGLDHVLFIVSLFLLSPKLKVILWQSLAFTVAHSITLGLAMYKVVSVPSSIIEPVIALSIAYVAIENIFTQKLKPSRIGIVFLFGLIHGLGFAGALAELGLPANTYFTSLLMFNAGVELGQLTVILILYLLIGIWFGKKPYYHKYIVIPISAVIACVALYWAVERIFL